VVASREKIIRDDENRYFMETSFLFQV